MRSAFPTSEYYDGSAQPSTVGRRRAYPAPRPADRVGDQHWAVPTFTGNHWMDEVPSFAPAASLRVRRGHSPQPPCRMATTGPRSSPPPPRSSGYAPPTQAISARFDLVITLRGVTTPVPHVHRSISLTGPAPSGSTDTSRPRRGCFPPSPTSPGSGCLLLQAACHDKPPAAVSHRCKVTSASWRTTPGARSSPLPARSRARSWSAG
jgi:hypothetical protein